jgi:crotonobetainyl-CoA:carnitine CoA-transferase CaiB-like acyl-CoA transferase
MPGPLEGIRIIDLTAIVLGPLATMHLADLGADVIKIEPPEGDVIRVPGNPKTPKMGPIFLNANRNKRSVCLDLKRPEGVAVIKRLLESADVLVHNSRPQAIERLGLGYEAVKTINPRLVYAYGLGYKRSGPYGHKAAYDDLVQGASGAAMLQSRVDGGPPRFLPSLFIDKTTGLHLAMAIMAALVHRERTGEGQLVEVPMFETFAAFLLVEHMYGATWDPPRGDSGYGRVLSPHRRPYKTKDGYVCALPYTEKQWTAFTSALGRPDLATDPRFATQAGRANNQPAAQQIIAELMQSRTTDEWLAFFDEADIPAMRVNDIDDLFDDPHLKETDFFTMREHPSEGLIRTTASPFAFEKTPASYRRHAPVLGADGPEVLREAGVSQEELEALLRSGTLRVPSGSSSG